MDPKWGLYVLWEIIVPERFWFFEELFEEQKLYRKTDK